jgi:aromatic-L-amino-acid/L-tryptophan decarboxylase
MTPEEGLNQKGFHDFRQAGYQLIDWIADYMEKGYDGPVSPSSKPGALLEKLPLTVPKEGQGYEPILQDFFSDIVPGLTHWNDPRFFGYFPSNHSPPSILAELLSAGLNVNVMSWATSPAATELETRMMQWLGEMIGLPWAGVIQDTASTGTFAAVLSAREQIAQVNQAGFYQQNPLVAYASSQAHSSIKKAIRMAGIGDAWLREIPVDEAYALKPECLKMAIQEDRDKGYQPFLVIGTVGSTSTTAVDPISKIADICAEENLWLHVDGAMAGSAAILPEMRWLMDGVLKADSFLFNPHKWLMTNFDCTAYFCKNPMALKHALAIQPEYLKTQNDAVVENYRDWVPQLGRRFRALKLWFVIRYYGLNGLQEKIRLHLHMAQEFADWVETQSGFNLLERPKLNTVCFYLETDEETEALMQAVNTSGEAFLTHTRLDVLGPDSVQNRFVIRVSFGQTHSNLETLKHLCDVLQCNAQKLLAPVG